MPRTQVLLTLASGVLAILAAVAAQAAVTASGPSGFIVKIDVSVATRPDELYDRFAQIGSWWNDAHTYSGKATNMTLESRVGGCFCESLPDGQVIRHMDVVFTKPGKALRLSGGLGPLKKMGATGIMALQFSGTGAGTRLQLTYTVSGFTNDKDAVSVAPAVDGVLREQLNRLKHFAETGKPAA